MRVVGIDRVDEGVPFVTIRSVPRDCFLAQLPQTFASTSTYWRFPPKVSGNTGNKGMELFGRDCMELIKQSSW